MGTVSRIPTSGPPESVVRRLVAEMTDCALDSLVFIPFCQQVTLLWGMGMGSPQ